MKKILTAIFMLLAMNFGTAQAAEVTTMFHVPDMFCASCPYIVKGAISEVEGVISVVTSLAERMAIITYDDEITNLAALLEATANVGYEASVIDNL
ncbi:MAG: cation transporter [Rhizobiales bacterium]|nr:cation transporter [Hyphomicrobiales bacterium]NRB12782.1 cation transporter [Hyphomicrobiales bacterium]